MSKPKIKLNGEAQAILKSSQDRLLGKVGNNPDDWLDFALDKYDFAERVIDEAVQQGFRILQQPGETEPCSPTGLSAMSGEELGDLLDEYGEWHDYLDNKSSLLDLFMECSKLGHEVTDAFLRIINPGTKTVGELKLAPMYVEANSDYRELRAKKALIDDRRHRILKNNERISRHIAIRLEGTSIARRRQNVMSTPTRGPGYSPTKVVVKKSSSE
jgi:hypothetical protein